MESPHDDLSSAAPKKSVFSALIDRGKELFDALYDKVWTPREVTYHTLPMRVFTTIWRIVEITINGTINPGMSERLLRWQGSAEWMRCSERSFDTFRLMPCRTQHGMTWPG